MVEGKGIKRLPDKVMTVRSWPWSQGVYSKRFKQWVDDQPSTDCNWLSGSDYSKFFRVLPYSDNQRRGFRLSQEYQSEITLCLSNYGSWWLIYMIILNTIMKKKRNF